MPSSIAPALVPTGEARVALKSVAVEAHLRGLLSEVTMTQTYQNLEDQSIEAVYTFPLPLDAVLLDLSLELNGKTLKGIVQPKVEAEERYEDAITDGDTAILLQRVESGIFALNVGSILPNEKAVIKFRYAELHRWQGDSLRFRLPTTIAPRYGDPSLNMAPHQVPEYVLVADHEFSITVRVEGDLAQADIDCPSHQVQTHQAQANTGEQVREISLVGECAQMDRDFVLVVRKPLGYLSEVFQAKDGDERVVLVPFSPTLPDRTTGVRRCVQLVVDCSGSMGGDSITQARIALREVMPLLRRQDRFNVIAFGSSCTKLFAKPVRASMSNIRCALRFIGRLDANMGGTEIGQALRATHHKGWRGESLPSDLLLITDGQVWEHEEIIDLALALGSRVFSVGVGSAAAEPFVRQIAERTSGACELVTPQEDMQGCIARQFRRIIQSRAESVRVEWPTKPLRETPAEIKAVYAGDTIHAFAWLDGDFAQSAQLAMTVEGGEEVIQDLRISDAQLSGEQLVADLPRIAAHRLLPTLDVGEAAELAVRHQLVTEHTSCVLVYEREASERSADIPAIRKVPHELAAGWGGLGSVANLYMDKTAMICEDREFASAPRCMMDDAEPRESASMAAYELTSKREKPVAAHAVMDAEESMLAEEKITSRRHSARKAQIAPSHARSTGKPQKAGPELTQGILSIDFDGLIEGLNGMYSADAAAHLEINRVYELVNVGLDEDVGEWLLSLVDDESDESSVVTRFLFQLSVSEAGEAMTRHLKRLIRKAKAQNSPSREVTEAISEMLTNGGVAA